MQLAFLVTCNSSSGAHSTVRISHLPTSLATTHFGSRANPIGIAFIVYGKCSNGLRKMKLRLSLLPGTHSGTFTLSGALPAPSPKPKSLEP